MNPLCVSLAANDAHDIDAVCALEITEGQQYPADVKLLLQQQADGSPLSCSTLL